MSEPENLLLPDLPADFGEKGVKLGLEWCYDYFRIRLTAEQWAEIRRGGHFERNGPRWHSDDASFKTVWKFRKGTITVEYGNDGGIAYEGDLQGADIQEMGKRRLKNFV